MLANSKSRPKAGVRCLGNWTDRKISLLLRNSQTANFWDEIFLTAEDSFDQIFVFIRTGICGAGVHKFVVAVKEDIRREAGESV